MEAGQADCSVTHYASDAFDPAVARVELFATRRIESWIQSVS